MLSVVILTRNEEKNIGECIKSVKLVPLVREILVVDDCSTDKTAIIAKRRGAKVYKRSLNGDFASQRNFGLEKAKNEWVLFLDADERISPLLAREIVRRLKKANKKDICGFYFSRQDFFINRWLKFGETAKVRLLRLGKKSSGIWQGKVHETWQIKGRKEEFKNPLLHFSHPNLTETLTKINLYTSLRAKELKEQGVKANWLTIIAYPLAKFLKDYFFYQGFRDKTAGAVFAILMSLHSFLVRGKLWLLWQKNESKRG